ncbi:rCG41281 [Rattus norvegicus]|uniref:RCG41281 n=1 Tax=Rattus norvegicus TaxID=10116 RepID=A6KNF4_RAT|nr:rCG41281 [Rattus norvegicus]
MSRTEPLADMIDMCPWTEPKKGVDSQRVLVISHHVVHFALRTHLLA